MDSGIYIVTLNNIQPISVNAHDLRVAEANCKVETAKPIITRQKNYHKTFSEENVNFKVLAKTKDINYFKKLIL